MPHTALRLINATAEKAAHVTPAQEAARKRAARVPTPAEQMAQQRLTLLSQTYSLVLSDDQRRAYKTIAQRFPVGKTGSTAARACFIALNTARLQAGMDILLDASAVQLRDMLPSFPAYTLSATVTAGVFSLKIALAADWIGRYLVTATRPLSSGVMEISRSAYQLILSEDFMPAVEYDVATAYQNTFRLTAAVGTRVGVCITPLSPIGFPGTAVFHDALVTAA